MEIPLGIPTIVTLNQVKPSPINSETTFPYNSVKLSKYALGILWTLNDGCMKLSPNALDAIVNVTRTQLIILLNKYRKLNISLCTIFTYVIVNLIV